MDSQNGSPGAAAAAPTLLMTPAGGCELRAELERLRGSGREEFTERLREARAFGDDSNNDEIHAIREEEAVLEARIASLEDVLARAAIVDLDAAGGGVAVLGSSVTVEDLESGKTSTYRLGGAHEPIERDFVSAASPMGQALMGAAPGHVIAAQLPGGRVVRVRVLEVALPPTPMRRSG